MRDTIRTITSIATMPQLRKGENMTNDQRPPGNFHLPFPGFIHFGHFMPQMDINALHFLASRQWERVGRKLIAAEIGSFTGASALALAGYCERLYCIDTWNGGPNPDDAINRTYAEHQDGSIKQAFLDNTVHYSDRIVQMVRYSAMAAKELALKRFDLVFLDGDHSYAGVKADLEAWSPLVRAGGILCGHDFGEQFPGVKCAVRKAYGTYCRAMDSYSGYDVIGNVWWKEMT